MKRRTSRARKTPEWKASRALCLPPEAGGGRGHPSLKDPEVCRKLGARKGMLRRAR